jgi:tetratricopeptide (TPR) repeat protein
LILNIEFEKKNFHEVRNIIQQMQIDKRQNIRSINYYIGLIGIEMGEYESAIAHFKENLVLSADKDIINRLYLAICYLKLDELEKAEHELINFLRQNFQLSLGHLILSEVYLKQGRISEALFAATINAIASTNTKDFDNVYKYLESFTSLSDQVEEKFTQRTDTTRYFIIQISLL